MSEAEQDLDIAIGHYAELLASNLHAQRAAHFPPDAKKVMRSLTSGEAAELLGVDHTYLRKLHREGKIADVETTAGSHRRYTLDDIWEIRHALEANAKKPGTYVPGRRAGDELQIVSGELQRRVRENDNIRSPCTALGSQGISCPCDRSGPPGIPFRAAWHPA